LQKSCKYAYGQRETFLKISGYSLGLLHREFTGQDSNLRPSDS